MLHLNQFNYLIENNYAILNFGVDEIFANNENTVKIFGRTMIEYNMKPKVEVFDKGMVMIYLNILQGL